MIGNLKWVYIIISVGFVLAGHSVCLASDKPFFEADSLVVDSTYIETDTTNIPEFDSNFNLDSLTTQKSRQSIYALPYSVTGRDPNWHRLWTNTAVLSGAYVATLLVLECLPEDATSWNRAEIREVPLFKRWFKNIFKRGPEWDHDKFYFNYLLHPYAGAAYFMSARSCGFNMWQSLLYCTCVSTIGWEFGIEAFMERPSIQDLFVTPLVGSALGEGFYAMKRYIVHHNYHLLGSKALGYVAAFVMDPINEFIGYFAGNEAREVGKNLSINPTYKGFALSVTF
jgi:hypothetical protein